jgi:hypothetical protein
MSGLSFMTLDKIALMVIAPHDTNSSQIRVRSGAKLPALQPSHS